MDINFTIPESLWPLILGLVVLGVGGLMVKASNLLLKLLGLVVSLAGVTLLLTPIPSDWVSEYVKFGIVILVFIALSAAIARSGGKSDKAVTVTGAVLVFIGVLAFISYFTVPSGMWSNVIEDGFAALSRIFGLAGTQLE